MSKVNIDGETRRCIGQKHRWFWPTITAGWPSQTVRRRPKRGEAFGHLYKPRLSLFSRNLVHPPKPETSCVASALYVRRDSFTFSSPSKAPCSYCRPPLSSLLRDYCCCSTLLSLAERRVPRLGGSGGGLLVHGRVATELRQLERRRQRSAVRAHAVVGGRGGEVAAGLCGREARTRVRIGQPERPDEPVAGRFRGPGQQVVEHGPLPAEYEEHEHAPERVDRVRHVPVVRRRLNRPRDHLEHERDAHQTEQLQVQRQPANRRVMGLDAGSDWPGGVPGDFPMGGPVSAWVAMVAVTVVVVF